ncbi:hypothetical protein TNCV_1381921 [Trichonephila clavipes]|nr:hypothetical protein TNCV_1381921 [Trichonephila clavipes]
MTIDGACLTPRRRRRERLQENNSSVMDKYLDVQTNVWRWGVQDGPIWTRPWSLKGSCFGEMGEQRSDSRDREIEIGFKSKVDFPAVRGERRG